MKKTTKLAGALALLIIFTAVSFMSISGPAQAEIRSGVKNMANKFERLLGERFLKGHFLIQETTILKEKEGLLKGDATVQRIYYPKSKAEYEKMKASDALVKSDLTKIVISVEVFAKPLDAQKNSPKKLKQGSFNGENYGEVCWSSYTEKKTLEKYKEDLETKKAEEEAKKAEEEAKKNPRKKPQVKKPGDATAAGTADNAGEVKKPEKKLSPRDQRLKDKEDKKKQEEEAKKDEELKKKLETDPENFNLKQLIILKKNVIIQISALNYTKEPDAAVLEGIAEKLVSKI
jgi:hypothetical protein